MRLKKITARYEIAQHSNLEILVSRTPQDVPFPFSVELLEPTTGWRHTAFMRTKAEAKALALKFAKAEFFNYATLEWHLRGEDCPLCGWSGLPGSERTLSMRCVCGGRVHTPTIPDDEGNYPRFCDR